MFQNITMDVTEDEIERVNNKRDIKKIIRTATVAIALFVTEGMKNEYD